MAQDQKYINAFNYFNSEIESDPITIKHSGTQGNEVIVSSADQYLEWDNGAEEHWANFLDSQGLELICSLEDAINGTFPELEVSIDFSLEFNSSNASVQDNNSINEITRILKGIIQQLENSDPNDEYIDRSIRDLNGNDIGNFNLTIESE